MGIITFLNVEELIKIRDALRQIHYNPVHLTHGICGNFERILTDRSELFSARMLILVRLIMDWPKFSGHCVFWIKDPEVVYDRNDFGYTEFSAKEQLWEGTQGQLRREALVYLMERLQETIDAL